MQEIQIAFNIPVSIAVPEYYTTDDTKEFLDIIEKRVSEYFYISLPVIMGEPPEKRFDYQLHLFLNKLADNKLKYKTSSNNNE